MLTDHQHRAQQQEHERPRTRRLSGRVECTQTTQASAGRTPGCRRRNRATKARISSGKQWLGQPRPLDGNHKERLRREVVESARRVCQERHGTTVATTTTRSHGESRRTRTLVRAKRTVKPNEKAMECHGGRLMECHEDRKRRTQALDKPRHHTAKTVCVRRSRGESDALANSDAGELVQLNSSRQPIG